MCASSHKLNKSSSFLPPPTDLLLPHATPQAVVKINSVQVSLSAIDLNTVLYFQSLAIWLGVNCILLSMGMIAQPYGKPYGNSILISFSCLACHP